MSSFVLGSTLKRVRLFSLLSLLFIFSACSDGNTTLKFETGDSGDGDKTQCSDNSDCDNNKICVEGQCLDPEEPTCTSHDDCLIGYHCDFTRNLCIYNGDNEPMDGDIDGDMDANEPIDGLACDAPCRDSSECPDDCPCDPTLYLCRMCGCVRNTDCPAPYQCDGCHCIAPRCINDQDCPGEAVCIGETCDYPPDPCNGYTLSIVEPLMIIRSGISQQLQAVLTDRDGQRISYLAPDSLYWSSDDFSVAQVVSNRGLITGGSNAGVTQIRAELRQCSRVFDTVPVTNYTTVSPANLRVLAIDDQTSELITTAEIQVNGIPMPLGTDRAHRLDSINCSSGCDLQIESSEHGIVTLLGLTGNDWLVPLPPLARYDSVGGVTGRMDDSLIPEAWLQGTDVRVALAGLSYKGSWADWHPKDLVGDGLRTHFALGSTIEEEVPSPAGLEVFLSGNPILGPYRAIGAPGRQTLWGFLGYGELTHFIEAVSELYADAPTMPSTLIHIFKQADGYVHGFKTGLDLTAQLMQEDTEDLNMNGSRNDFVPPYNDLPDIELSLKGTETLTRTAGLHFASLPALNTDIRTCAEGLIVMLGVDEPHTGFSPLGLAAGLDTLYENDEPSDCRFGDDDNNVLDINYAPQHSGVYLSPYLTVAVAFDIGDHMSGTLHAATPFFSHSMLLHRSGNPPQSVDMPAFLDAPSRSDADIVLDGGWGTLSLSLPAQPEADFRRLLIVWRDPGSELTHTWSIYFGNGVISQTLRIPSPVALMLSAQTPYHSMLQAIKLNDLDFDDLMNFNGTNMLSLNHLMSAISATPLD